MLTRAWIWLVGLSLTATLITVFRGMLPAGLEAFTAIIILMIAGIKADVILSAYLELHEVPRIRNGFRFALILFLVLAAGLYLAG
ncbi:MAG: hypothetical protein ACK5II_03010 [Paracoccus sp. (in: a-proteobacteria)]